MFAFIRVAMVMVSLHSDRTLTKTEGNSESSSQVRISLRKTQGNIKMGKRKKNKYSHKYLELCMHTYFTP